MKITLTREDLNRSSRDKKYAEINIFDFSSALPKEVFNVSDKVVFIENDGTSIVLKERKRNSSELRDRLMSVRRDFIQEIIDSTKKYSESIQTLYDKLNNGEITVGEFEEEYRTQCLNLKENTDDEYYHPNNGCTYVLNSGEEVKPGNYNEYD